MAQEIRGTLIKAVKGASVTGDGNNFVVGLETSSGEEMVLMLPTEATTALIVLGAQCSAEADRLKGAVGRSALNVTKWKLTRDEASNHDVLLLTVGGQTELAFRLPTRDPKEALKVLSNRDSAEAEEGVDPSQLN